jgi:DNA-directed RNA polymerase specialized sigma24 family protein
MFGNAKKDDIERIEEQIGMIAELLIQLNDKIDSITVKKKRPRKERLTQQNNFTHVDENERQQMLKLYQDDKSITEIAALLGRNPSTISKHLHRMLD